MTVTQSLSQPGEVRRGLRFRTGMSAALAEESLEISYQGNPLLRLRGLSAPMAERVLGLQSIPQPGPPLSEADQALLDRLLSRVGRCLAESVWQDETLLAEAESLRARQEIETVELLPEDQLRLSKFAYLHRRDGLLLLESPVTGARVVLHDPRALTLIWSLSSPATVADLVALEPGPTSADHPSPDREGLSPETVLALLELFVAAGVLDDARSGATEFASDTPVQRQWDFHDLLFHSRSRYGRTDEPFGGVFPYRGELEPLSAIRPAHDGEQIDLPRPSLEQITGRDPSLVDVMESRHSVRHYGAEPMTVEQLGEFLYRVARVRGSYGPMPETGMPYPASSRPYPCGGAGYELEFYLTVRRCAGLAPGVYHYRADTHQLTRLSTPEPLRQQLLDSASVSAGGNVHPDVLVTITARFQRISWKYRSIAYAVTLKHVGVVYQTMYLVATAMQLGACGLGSGNSDLSAEAFGLDYLQESSVGEFILGSLPDPAEGAPLPGGNPIAKLGADQTWQARLDPQWYGDSLSRLRAGRRP